MAFTQADLDAANAAIATAERQVTNGSQSVTYRSITELTSARDLIVADLAKQAVASGEKAAKPRQTRLFYAGRGY